MFEKLFRSGPMLESPNNVLRLRFHTEVQGKWLVLTVIDRETGEVLGSYQIERTEK